MPKITIQRVPDHASLINVDDKGIYGLSYQAKTQQIPSEPIHEERRATYPHPQPLTAQHAYQLKNSTLDVCNQDSTVTATSNVAQPLMQAVDKKDQQQKYQASLNKEKVELDALSQKIKAIRVEHSNTNKNYPQMMSKQLDHLQSTVDNLLTRAQLVQTSTFEKMLNKKQPEMAHDYSHGEFFLSAYQQAKKAQELAKDIRQQVNQNLVLSTPENRNALHHLAELMNQLVLIFASKAHIYLGKHAESNLDAHVVYSLNHLYKPLKNQITPGYQLATQSGYAVNGGAKLPNMPVSIGAGINYNKNKFLSTGADGDIDYLSLKSLGAGVNAKVNFNPIGSAKGALSGNLELLGDFYATDNQHAQGVAYALKYMGVRKNDQRLIKGKILDVPREIKNKLGAELFGIQANNPYLSKHAKSTVLEDAQGQQKLLHDLYQGLDRLIASDTQPIPPARRKRAFDNNNSLKMSMPAPASQAGTAEKTHAPWRNFTVKAEVAGSIGVKHDDVGSGIDAELKGSVAKTHFGLHGQLLQPTHALLSVARTYSHEASQELAKEIREKVWLVKSDNDFNKLPVHLHKTIAWVNQVDQNKDDVNHLDKLLTSASNLLRELGTGFASFEKEALNLLALCESKNDIDSYFFEERYLSLRQSLSKHQLSADRLPETQMHDTKRLKQEIARVWDTYSSAIGMLDVEISNLLARHAIEMDQQPDQVKTALHQFASQYQRIAHQLAEPQLPFLKEHLYRHSALIADASLSRDAHSATLSGAHNLQLLNASDFGIGVRLLNQQGHASITQASVKQHPNPLRSGTYTTVEKRVDVSAPNLKQHITHGMWTTLSGIPGLKRNANINAHVLNNMAQAENQKKINDLMTAFGLGLDAYQVKETEVRRNGEIQTRALQVSNKKGLSLTTPNLIPQSGGYLQLGKTVSQTETKALNQMMGSDLAYHVLKSWLLEQRGIDAQTIAQAQSLLQNQSGNKDDCSKLFAAFFDACTTNSAIKNDYFGLNGIGGLLKKFSELNRTDSLEPDTSGSEFPFVGFNVFKDKMTQAYLERVKTAQYAAKNLLANNSSATQEQNVFKKIGTTPDTVKNLLAQQMPVDKAFQAKTPQTVFEFLEAATPEQRQMFYQTTEIGSRLFMAYLSIIDRAKEIKSVFLNFPLSVSTFAEQSANSK